MISQDNSIFQEADDERKQLKTKEVKSACQAIFQSLEEIGCVLKETLLLDTSLVPSAKDTESKHNQLKKQFFNLRYDVLTSDSLKRTYDCKERQLHSYISQQESIIIKK